MEISADKLRAYERIYLLYLDETGYSPFNERGYYADPKQRYLTVAGIFVRGDIYWSALQPNLTALKQKFFGDASHILHYTDLFVARRESPLDPETRKQFWEEFLRLLVSTECSFVSITIDKQAMQERYSTWLHDPYHLTMAWHIERVIYSLARTEKVSPQGVGPPLRARIAVEARATGSARSTPVTFVGHADRRLANSYRRIFREGHQLYSRTLRPAEIQKRLVSGELSIAPKSANKVGLQIADLICFPLHWNTLFELCPDELRNMKGNISKTWEVDRFWTLARDRIAISDAGERIGYGIKLFPEHELF